MLVAEYFAFQAFIAATDGAVQVSKPGMARLPPEVVVVCAGGGVCASTVAGVGCDGAPVSGIGVSEASGVEVGVVFGVALGVTFGVTFGFGVVLGFGMVLVLVVVLGFAEFGVGLDAGTGSSQAAMGPVAGAGSDGQAGFWAGSMLGCRASPALAAAVAAAGRTEASACAARLTSLP